MSANIENIQLKIPDFLNKKGGDVKNVKKKNKMRYMLITRVALSGSIGYGLALALLRALNVDVFHDFFLITILVAPSILLGIISGGSIDNLLKRKDSKSMLSISIILITPIIVLLYSVVLFWGMSIVNTLSTQEVLVSEAGEHFVADDFNILFKAKEEVWGTLSLENRIDFAQYITDNEVRAHGLPVGLKVVTSTNLPEGVAGQYDHSNYKIIVNEECLRNAQDGFYIIRIVSHEVFHAEQFAQIEMYKSLDEKFSNLELFEEIATYIKEYQDYQKEPELKEPLPSDHR